MINWVPGLTLELVEKIVILQAFQFYRGNKTQTASSIGIAIRTLDTKLEKYEADKRDEEKNAERLRNERALFLQRQREAFKPTSLSSLSRSDTGIRMESITQAAPQPKVPVSERIQVQEVLPKHTSKGSHKRPSA